MWTVEVILDNGNVLRGEASCLEDISQTAIDLTQAYGNNGIDSIRAY